MALTTNQITDILGRPPSQDETTKLSNSSIDNVLAYKKQSANDTGLNTFNQSMRSPVTVTANPNFNPNQPQPVNYNMGTATLNPNPTQNTQDTQQQPTPTQQPTGTMAQSTPADTASQYKQQYDTALSQYQDIQKQITDIDKTMQTSYDDKVKAITAAGGIVDQAALKAQVAGENSQLMAQRKALADTQANSGKLLQQAQLNYNQESNRQQQANLQSQKLAQAGQQFQQKQNQQAGQFEQNEAIKLATLQNKINAGTASPTDVNDIANGIINGTLPPDTKGLYKIAGSVKAELARRGFDLNTASKDYIATQKFLATQNGATITRLRNAVEFVYETVPNVRDAVKNWNDQVGAGIYPVLNSANLISAKNGLYGADAQKAAVALDTYIADMTSELATVYKGGTSQTDDSLKLAAKNLSSNWSVDVLNDALNRIEKNTNIRRNSLLNLQPITSSNPKGDTPKSDKSSNDNLMPAGTVVSANGKNYQVGSDGLTLTEI